MRLLLIFIIISFSSYSQEKNPVIIVPTANVVLDSSTSYIYCSTMEIMWNKLSDYLGELPKSTLQNTSFDLLNQSISQNYQVPIENDFIVANSGLVKDSIIEKINSELEKKFHTSWNQTSNLPENALVSYTYLKKDAQFYYPLDDHFYNQPFNSGSVVNIDYFGIKEGDPNRSRSDIFIHDYKNSNDFIIQLRCLDTLDEIYFAKIPFKSTLLNTYQEVISRVISDNTELFNGGDILKIPYIKFDTTARYSNIESVILTNELLKGKAFQSTSQRINFDLNPQGIKLESIAESIIDFADFENPPPRILAFDKPFLIIMKRSNSKLPYFMYWVSGVEFMKSYILKLRKIEDNETDVIGNWKLKEYIYSNGEIEKVSDNTISIIFKPDGTYELARRGDNNSKGTWSYGKNVIRLNRLNSSNAIENETEWILDEFSKEKFIVGGKTKGVFIKE